MDGIRKQGFATDLGDVDVHCSFTMGNSHAEDDHNHGDHEESLDLVKLVVISEDSLILFLFKPCLMVLALGSTYGYAWLAVFSDQHINMWLILAIELMFGLEIVFNFLTDYKNDGEIVPVRSLPKIVNRYLKGKFLQDLIPTLPLPFLFKDVIPLHFHLFYLLKILRIVKVLDVLNVPIIMKMIKDQKSKRIQVKIHNNPDIGTDTLEDHNKIDQMMVISYCLKTLKLILMIVNLSFFIAVFWIIMCKLIEPVDNRAEGEEARDFFLEYIGFHELEDSSDWTRTEQDGREMLAVIYFAFTSLTTVGFGDYHPRSDLERVVCAFILLFGVAIFSYIMGTFIEILDEFKNSNAELDDGDSLSKFFQVMARFNGDKQLPEKQIDNIMQFFDYKWKMDKNQAIDEEAEIALLMQLPSEVQDTLYSNFLFQQFLRKF